MTSLLRSLPRASCAVRAPLACAAPLRSLSHSAVRRDAPVSGFTGAVGKTPLVRINSLSDETGCEILGKAEFMEPGGSVKDRAALYIVLDAEKKGAQRVWQTQADRAGQISAGGTVVEGTAGNTGIGLAHVCRAKGYKCVIYMPNTQSQEKIDPVSYTHLTLPTICSV